MSETAFKKLISGQTRGVLPELARGILSGLSLPYRLSMACRNRAFDSGWKKSNRVKVPVISVGNLTTGGTGKTPVVASIVQYLRNSGQRPGIISRGYRADPSGFNDEKRVLDLLCPGVPHIQNPDRVTAAHRIISENQVTSIVLDDAFQHRRIARDLNIVLIDATNPFGYGYLLPRGLLREPICNLGRADMVLITRSNAVSTVELQRLQQEVRQLVRPGVTVCLVSFPVTGLVTNSGQHVELSAIAGEPVMVMTAIGNPAAFVATCEGLNARIVATRFFPDHHHYTATDLNEVRQQARQAGAARIVTTLKDLVKIPSGDDQILAIQIGTTFANSDEEQEFHHRVDAVLRWSTAGHV